MYTNLFDVHMHSDHSFDAEHSISYMCESAAEKGLSGICITDHCEMQEYEEKSYGRRVMESVLDARRCAQAYQGTMAVLAGMEISGTLWYPELTDQLFDSVKFDMVIASQHRDQNQDDIYYHDFKTFSPQFIDEYLTFYFSYLIEVAKKDRHDVIGHLTYPLRYICGRDKVPVNLEQYDDLIDELLRITAQKGKAIEINTSGLRGALKETLPPMKYVKRFRELGGEHVTIGSDAHNINDVGAGIPDGLQLLESCGYRYFTIYKKRQPVLLKII